MIVWDRGTWELHKDEDAGDGDRGGEVHAELFGEKVRGRIVLVRTKGGPGGGSGKENWLLLHKRDEHAVEGWDPEDHPALGAERAHERRGRGEPRAGLDP